MDLTGISACDLGHRGAVGQAEKGDVGLGGELWYRCREPSTSGRPTPKDPWSTATRQDARPEGPAFRALAAAHIPA